MLVFGAVASVLGVVIVIMLLIDVASDRVEEPGEKTPPAQEDAQAAVVAPRLELVRAPGEDYPVGPERQKSLVQDFTAQDKIDQDLLAQDHLPQDLMTQDSLAKDFIVKDFISPGAFEPDILEQDALEQAKRAQDALEQVGRVQDALEKARLAQSLLSPGPLAGDQIPQGFLEGGVVARERYPSWDLAFENVDELNRESLGKRRETLVVRSGFASFGGRRR